MTLCVFSIALLTGIHHVKATTFNSSNIYSGGDVVLQVPYQETYTTIGVLLVAALVEFAIDTASSAHNKYFRVMFKAIVQQVMIVGSLILALLFTQTVYDWPGLWVYMFKWSMMCLFLMIVLFIIEVLVLLWIAKRSASSWEEFESSTMDTQGVSLSLWQQQYRKSSYKFLDALKAYGYKATNGVRYSQYLSKMVRRNIFSMTEVKWVSWVCLATVAVLNGLRAEAFMKMALIGDENVADDLTDWQRFLNYISFVVLVGYVAMGFFIGVVVLLTKRLNLFLESEGSSQSHVAVVASTKRSLQGAHEGPQNEATGATLDTLDDPRSYLFRHSLDATLELVQLTMLVTQWYVSTFALGFVYQCIFRVDIAYGAPLLVAGFVPFIVPMLLSPRLLFVVTVLGSLGTNLDEYAVQYLIKAAKIPEAEWPEKMRRRLVTGQEFARQRRATQLQPREGTEAEGSLAPPNQET